MLRFDDAPKRAANLSQTVNTLLKEEVRRRLREQWLERNMDAIEAYNARIEREGTFAGNGERSRKIRADRPCRA